MSRCNDIAWLSWHLHWIEHPTFAERWHSYTYLHHQHHCVAHNESKDEVLECLWRHHTPYMELEAVIRNVPFQWFGLQSELNALTLKTLQGKKNNKISFLWSQVWPLSHCHSPTKGKTFMWLGWPRQNSHLVSSWRRKNGVLNSYFCRFLTTRHLRHAKETGAT